MYFASINDDGYCVSISSYSADNVITNPYLIGIDSYDISFIGRRYDFEECVWTDEWEERPDFDTESPIERLAQQQSDIELSLIENQLYMEMLGQQITDLELDFIDGGM